MGIRIPKTILQSMGCVENENVELLMVKEGVLIRKVKRCSARSVGKQFTEEIGEMPTEEKGFA
ncbi:MAG: AbrB/MazE/SpoVT family DNA-binding domain-containing protein [Eubacteriales bacterium]|nr:AbrB/MazE/SpoVT family DNA-binding domain-containing protein [Eubacteriales bacterium]